MKSKKCIWNKAYIFLAAIVVLFFVTSCAKMVPVEEYGIERVYGFWNGLIHGLIAPVTFVISLFKDEIAMYAINNNGHLYDLGFILGVMIIFGGGGNRAGCKKKK